MADENYYDLTQKASAIDEVLNNLIGIKVPTDAYVVTAKDRKDETKGTFTLKVLPPKTDQILSSLNSILYDVTNEPKVLAFQGYVDPKTSQPSLTFTTKNVGTVDGVLNQLVTCDGNSGLTKAFLYGCHYYDSSFRDVTEYRFGPYFVEEDGPIVQGPLNRVRFVLTNNVITPLNGKSTYDDDKSFKLSLQDNAHLFFSDSAKLTCGGNSEVVIDGDSRIYIHETGNINIDGIDSTYTETNDYWTYDPITLVVTGNPVSNPVAIRSDSYFKGAALVMHDASWIGMTHGATIDMHDASCLSMGGASEIVAHDKAKLYLEKEAVTRIQDYSYVNLTDASCFIMQSGDYDVEEFGPSFVMNGGSNFIMNGKTEENAPLLLCEDTCLIFAGKKARGHKKGVEAPATVSDDNKEFGSVFNFQNWLNDSPKVKIADDTSIIMNAQNQGKCGNYINISASNEGINRVHLLDNIKLEMRQDSIFAMRGNIQGTEPWRDDFELYNPQIIPEVKEGMSYGGSAFLMQGNPIFHMRQQYDLSKATFNYIVSSVDELNTKTASLGRTAKVGEDIYYAKRMPVYENGTIKRNSDNEVVTEYRWVKWEGLSYERKENNPLLEVVDNAEVRIKDNATFSLSDDIKIEAGANGITFSSSEKTVSFSFEELERLKNLLA